jgi:hypothetical protein
MGPTPLTFRLGETTFLDIREAGLEASGVDWLLGANIHYYREYWYFGRPGRYRHYILDAGVALGGAALDFMLAQPTPPHRSGGGDIAPAVPDAVRGAMIVDAYTIVDSAAFSDASEWSTAIPAEVW